MTDPYRTQPSHADNTHADNSHADNGVEATKQAAAQAKDAAADVAGTGRQAATEVAQTGQDAARDVAQETKDQASDLLGRTRQQVTEQVEVQQASIVDTLRTLGDQLASMTENTDEQGTAVDLAAQGRDRARSAADWLDHRDPDQVLDELRRVGRERPGAFLLGAALAGVVAGRLTRGVVAVHTDDSPSDAPAQPGRHVAPAGAAAPATDGWNTP